MPIDLKAFLCVVVVLCNRLALLFDCPVDPCVEATCPDHPDAICRSNNCGGCNAEFFDADGYDVTSTCIG